MQFRTVRKFSQNVIISFEICVKVFHLMNNVNISFEICTNVSEGTLGGRGSTSGKVRGRFGEGSEKVRADIEPPSSRHRAGTAGASARPPCGHLYRILIIPLLEPSSELAIREIFH